MYWNPPMKTGGACSGRALKLNISLKDLRKSKRNRTQIRHLFQDQAISRNAAVPPEFDFRGLRVEEGLKEVDKYIDQAYLAGMTKVSLIHGKGTGLCGMRCGIFGETSLCGIISQW